MSLRSETSLLYFVLGDSDWMHERDVKFMLAVSTVCVKYVPLDTHDIHHKVSFSIIVPS